MRNPSVPRLPHGVPRQLSMALDSVRLRGMNPSERISALARLASLLMETAGVEVGKLDDDER